MRALLAALLLSVVASTAGATVAPGGNSSGWTSTSGSSSLRPTEADARFR
jgi:hypothetical protein